MQDLPTTMVAIQQMKSFLDKKFLAGQSEIFQLTVLLGNVELQTFGLFIRSHSTGILFVNEDIATVD
jgi:hypothetical protein